MYRWWTCGYWQDFDQYTLKLGPVSIIVYQWLGASSLPVSCCDVCLLNRWVLLDPVLLTIPGYGN